jgi:hypothetical protein
MRRLTSRPLGEVYALVFVATVATLYTVDTVKHIYGWIRFFRAVTPRKK